MKLACPKPRDDDVCNAMLLNFRLNDDESSTGRWSYPKLDKALGHQLVVVLGIWFRRQAKRFIEYSYWRHHSPLGPLFPLPKRGGPLSPLPLSPLSEPLPLPLPLFPPGCARRF